MPKVSILMPSLNVAGYIHQCMDSVIHQTLKDIEIICIDAGSTDGTLEILQKFQEKDSRINIIRSEKKSYGYQMNLGLAAAAGDYIGIVETDDWAEPDMFEKLYQAAQETDADIIKSNYYWYYYDTQKKNVPFENLSGCTYEELTTPFANHYRLFSTTPAIWSGIYKKSMLDNAHIQFNETPGASYQDTSFHFMVCTAAKTVYLLREHFLHYRRDNENSSVNTDAKCYCVSDEMHYYEQYINSYVEDKEKMLAVFMPLKFEKYSWNYNRIAPQFQWDFLRLMFSEFTEHKKQGHIQINQFTPTPWQQLQNLLKNPIQYFKNTCKKYSTRKSFDDFGTAEIVKNNNAENPLVSVIIPVYNSADFMRETLDSAVHQSLKNIEIICVDDGSDDDSLRILQEYAEKDDRIAILHQFNKGLPSARNTGLRFAKGKYIQFLDSDDQLQSYALGLAVEYAEETNVDILYFDGESIYETEELKEKLPYYEHAYEYYFPMEKPITGKDYFCQQIEDAKYRVSACMMLIKNDFLRENQISFYEGIVHEDNLFSFSCLMQAKKVYHISDRLYIRTVRQASIMTTGKNFFHLYGFLFTTQLMNEFCRKIDYDQRLFACIAKELEHLYLEVRSTYTQIKDKEKCKSKLTPPEIAYLNKIVMLPTRSKNQPKDDSAYKELNKVLNSTSFKTGYAITWPGRKIKDIITFIRKNGIKKTFTRIIGIDPLSNNTEPKVLFVSSDAYKASGAFLSEIALNKLLNRKFGIPTQIILPYYGSGNSMVNKANITNQVIYSYDWIIDKDQKHTKNLVNKKYNEHTKNLFAAVQIAKVAIDNNYNIIHSNTTYTYVGYLASKLTGLPHVWHVREFLEEDQNKEIYNKNRGYQMIADSDRVVAISKSLRDKYADIVPDKKLLHIYNGISKTVYYNPSKIILQNNKPIFLFLSGSSSPNKGRKDLVDACKIISDKGIDFELWFVGWCGVELQEYVKEAGLFFKTLFLGYQNNTADFYKKADIFFMCSKFEPFGRTTVEAMMGGNLVIGANTAGTRELITDNQTGLLYEYGNADDLASKILFALENRERSEIIAKNGQRFMSKEMTAEKNAEMISDLYTQLLSEQKPQKQIDRLISRIKINFTYIRYQIRKRIIGPIFYKENEEKDNTETSKSDTISDHPLVSVIIPVYNVIEYLPQCIESVCAQTLENIEIICVNDGSNDGSERKLREYAEKDKRIKIIDQPNSGYGAAMNKGISHATGEYIGIVESDDFIDKKMFAEMYNLAIERGTVDIIKSSYWLYYDTTIDKEAYKIEAPILSACHPPIPVFDVYSYPEIIYHHPSIWSCLYRRDFLNENAIRFVEAKGAGWVDNPFLLETFCKAKRITWTPKAYYFYRQTNPNASSFIKDCSMPFLRTGEMLDFLNRENIIDEQIRGSVYKRILYNAASALENPYYDAEKDDSIIKEQIQQIPEQFLEEKRVRDSERSAYYYFNKLK